MIGKRLNGRYKILRTIGGGGMANVYLAHDMILDRDVAVKVLRLDYVNEKDLMKRFQREAQSATSLTHPNIVGMYDVGDEDNQYFLVMEFVEGLTLKEYIQENSPVPLEDAVRIMTQLTSAISHAHDNGIIHRDIKPQNILVDQNGDIKITDFGIAMALSATSITQTNSVMGTVHYLSPEQARGGIATKKSDIYSLGIVMFELITGRLPFEGESAVSIALKHLQSDIPPPSKWSPNLPQSVENVILKATTKDAFYRYETVDEMHEDLSTVLNEARFNEPKFSVEPDNDATRAIPIIRNERNFSQVEETKVHKDKDLGKTKIEPPVKPHEEIKDKKKKRKKWPWILALVLLFLIGGAATMAALGMFGPSSVQVPDIVGETIENGEVILEENGLELGEIETEYDEEIEEGLILRTSPKATRTVLEGDRINVVVSSGKEPIELEDYVGEAYEDVQNAINDLFEDVSIEERYDAEPEGTILEQSPNAGEEVIPSETVLRLVISQGEETVEVEDLIGQSEDEIESFENRTGLVVNVTREEYSSQQPEGYVLSQNPSAGSVLPVGSSVNVVVSLGEAPLPVNNVIVPLTIEYQAPEEEPEEETDPPDESEPPDETEPPEDGDPPEVPGEPVPQTIRIFINDRDRNMDEPVEEFTITENVERSIRLVIAPGETGSYRVERDEETIIEQEIPYDENQ
ncbi:Stk1 family PASTA domain-containing Ser/Thr kinase [Jeotgalibacillus proteolyticus]|uniref:Serine/threonine-protein kinase PrkC n=1 Tax=Jeotgalibacillus proteolyticus TaxID=2082395 RepID=A0A2S5GGI3_9BACL|nr:Stk1 family PASTA domain-containing Ser/Thr kinase [Jeotgalibacillus proteolyticus]PPA72099.1 Stk1 family PASTA domain-containing Ser/Thr kinase [Jeotgalibacillus proteolyticus]